MLEIGTYVILLFAISSYLGCSLTRILLYVTIVKMHSSVPGLL